MSSQSDESAGRKPFVVNAKVRRYLRFFHEHRDKPITAMTMLRSYGWIWLLYAILVAYVLVVSLLNSADNLAAAAAVGFIIGAVLRDATHASRMARAWPVYREVLDWNKIDRLLDEDRSAVEIIE